MLPGAACSAVGPMPGGWASFIAEMLTAMGALAAAGIAYWQLKQIVNETKIQGDRERQWQTIAACQRYITDPVLLEAKRKIWLARGNGTKDRIEDVQSVKQDAIFIMNYLDSVAIGVRQGVYLKEVVKDNLRPVMVDAVARFIENGLGNFELNKEHFGNLIALVQDFRAERPDHRPVG
jgi:hypothetical protein